MLLRVSLKESLQIIQYFHTQNERKQSRYGNTEDVEIYSVAKVVMIGCEGQDRLTDQICIAVSGPFSCLKLRSHQRELKELVLS